MTTLKGKRFSILFNGKQVKQVKQVEDLNVTVSIERIAVSVVSPDLDDSNYILLLVAQAARPRVRDEADVTSLC